MTIKICEFCKKEFKAYKSKLKYCSKVCATKNAKGKQRKPRIQKQCSQCKKDFEVLPGKEAKSIKHFGSGIKYCSLKCSGKGHSKKYNHPSVHRLCLYCENPFVANKPCHKKKYCSKKCSFDFKKKLTQDDIKDKLPSIIEYRKNHTLAEVALKFTTSTKMLKTLGVYSTEKQLACPNEFSLIQQEYINGNMLGDGSCCYIPKDSKHNSKFSIGQNIKNKEYIQFLSNIYHPFTNSYHEKKARKPIKINGQISHKIEDWNGEYTESCELHTLTHPLFTKLRHKWYMNPFEKRSQKIIPRDLKLTWRTAAIWMCDDGTNYFNNRNRSLILYTDSFLHEDIDYLIARIKEDLDIKATIRNRSKNRLIRISGDEWFKFIEQIKPFVSWDCLQYKCINRLKKRGDNTAILEFLRQRQNRN